MNVYNYDVFEPKIRNLSFSRTYFDINDVISKSPQVKASKNSTIPRSLFFKKVLTLNLFSQKNPREFIQPKIYQELWTLDYDFKTREFIQPTIYQVKKSIFYSSWQVTKIHMLATYHWILLYFYLKYGNNIIKISFSPSNK